MRQIFTEFNPKELHVRAQDELLRFFNLNVYDYCEFIQHGGVIRRICQNLEEFQIQEMRDGYIAGHSIARIEKGIYRGKFTDRIFKERAYVYFVCEPYQFKGFGNRNIVKFKTKQKHIQKEDYDNCLQSVSISLFINKARCSPVRQMYFMYYSVFWVKVPSEYHDNNSDHEILQEMKSQLLRNSHLETMLNV